MQMDRDISPDGRGKYILINQRKLATRPRTAEELAAAILANPEAVEFGTTGSENEFFLIKLKDRYAQEALHAYAGAASEHDTEWAAAVDRLAERAGPASPYCKLPD